mgnify:CR=1 FL=1
MQSIPETHLIDLFKELSIAVPDKFEFPFQITYRHIEMTFDYQIYLPQNLLLYTSLGKIPEERQLEIYKAFLEANQLWSGSGGATIGVNPKTLEGMIAYQLHFTGMELNGFISLIEQFILLAELWRCFIEEQ